MELERKLALLADAAKYDASCASSGAPKRHAAPGHGIGSTTGMGICHSFTPDGRCVSLLKILLTNFCIYDCLYCVNRRSSDVPRARFAVSEVVSLTLSFYRRNYIEGLFLSSGIIRSADYTMERLVEVARSLREEHEFQGYIHLKTIPEASPELIAAAGRYADRLSVNIELPSRDALRALAPEKNDTSIKRAMGEIPRRESAAFRSGRTKYPDDRWRGCEHRREHHGYGGYVVPLLSVAANLLFGVQPVQALLTAIAESRATVDAGALLQNDADVDVRTARTWSKAVSQDVHKMHAFLRFHEAASEDGSVCYLAWFEPSHEILQYAVPFFFLAPGGFHSRALARLLSQYVQRGARQSPHDAAGDAAALLASSARSNGDPCHSAGPSALATRDPAS